MMIESRKEPSQIFHAQLRLLKMKDRVQESVVYLALDSYQLIFELGQKRQSLIIQFQPRLTQYRIDIDTMRMFMIRCKNTWIRVHIG